VFLPIKAILMNLASILATYGVLVLIFQYGWGDRFLGFSSLGGLGMFAPAILFAILFGLSTDYEVFMLSRVKEFYHETRNNEEAVARGLQNTAAVITAAGLVLVGTFGSFASADVVAVKEIGIGLAVGVLIDSTIVRVIMVPATMRLMGELNWWMPGWLRRVVPEIREGPALSPAS
jgi:RND superfamily putative drug exporter